ncbi:coenzyme Q4 [Aureococcus anophagefferens]|uniref:Coenzyme Q4 n=1 Tax=Aureococcus anophagefferens TaxID=44056 RepID=A0ABR1G8U3_AURAN
MLHARRFVARCPLRAALTRCSSSSHDAFDADARVGQRTSNYRGHLPTSPLQKAFAAGASALQAIANPERADMVGLLGEVTGRVALERLRDELRASAEGREVPRCGRSSRR